MLSIHTYDHGGDTKEAEERFDRTSFIDFSTNINPLGPPPSVIKMLRTSRSLINAYPEPRSSTLKKVLANRHRVSPENVIVGNGVTELLYLLTRAVSASKALVLAPTFSEYAHSQQAAGGEVHYQFLKPEDAFALPQKLDLQAGAGLVFCCNPNNPTGSYYPQSTLIPLIEQATGQGAVFALDYSFAGFLEPEPSRHLLLPANILLKRGIFFLYSFTNFYALPGLRLGYGIGPASLVASMEKLRGPWSVNALAQEAGLRSLKSPAFTRRIPVILSKWRQHFYRKLISLPGMKVFPSAANFLLVRLPDVGPPAFFFREQLAKEGLLIRDAGNFFGLDPFYFRVSVRLPAENAKLVHHLKKLIERYC